jgi:outer membrane protein TolC
VEMRFQSGRALKNDLQRSKIELLKAENIYLVAEKELKADKARLNILLGRPMDYAFSIDEDLKEEELKVDMGQAVAIALSNSPEVKYEEIRLESFNRDVAKEELSRLPSPFLAFRNVNETYDNDYNIIIGASFPLWGFNEGPVKKAKAQKEAQKVRLEAAKRCVAFDAYEASLDVELKMKQLELLKKSLEEADELIRLADMRYSEGGIDFVNFLDQVRTATETRMRYYEGLFELQSSVNKLEKVTYTSLRKEGYLK